MLKRHSDLRVKAKNDQAIKSTVFAGSVAASFGGSVGAALSGAGGSTVNRVNSDTAALITDTTGSGIEWDGSILIDADNAATIETSVMAVSVSAAFGTFAGSVAIGVSTATNEIAGNVRAGADRAVLLATGSVTISAKDRPSINAESTAVAVAISGGIGFSFAGGGAVATNTIATQVVAAVTRSGATAVEGSISGMSEIEAGGNLSVTADSLQDARAEVYAAAASFGLIAAAGAGTNATIQLGSIVDALIDKAEVYLEGASSTVDLRAKSLQKSYAESDALAVSSGASMGMSIVKTLDFTATRARVGEMSVVEAATLRIRAEGRDEIFQQSSASSGGLFAGIAGGYSDLDIRGTTVAGIGNKTRIEVDTLDVTADRHQYFDATANNFAIGALAGSGAYMATSLTGTADIVVGSQADIQAGDIVFTARNVADKSKYSNAARIWLRALRVPLTLWWAARQTFKPETLSLPPAMWRIRVSTLISIILYSLLAAGWVRSSCSAQTPKLAPRHSGLAARSRSARAPELQRRIALPMRGFCGLRLIPISMR